MCSYYSVQMSCKIHLVTAWFLYSIIPAYRNAACIRQHSSAVCVGMVVDVVHCNTMEKYNYSSVELKIRCMKSSVRKCKLSH